MKVMRSVAVCLCALFLGATSAFADALADELKSMSALFVVEAQDELAPDAGTQAIQIFVAPVTDRGTGTVCAPWSDDLEGRLINALRGAKEDWSIRVSQSLAPGEVFIRLSYDQQDRQVSLNLDVIRMAEDNNETRPTHISKDIDRALLSEEQLQCLDRQNLAPAVRCVAARGLDLRAGPSSLKTLRRFGSDTEFSVLAAYAGGKAHLVEVVDQTVPSTQVTRGFLNQPLGFIQSNFNCGAEGLALPLGTIPVGSGQPFRDCENICPELVIVPTDKPSRLGSLIYETGRDNDEEAMRQFTMPRRFAMARNEITYGDWIHCVAAGKCSQSRFARSDITLPVAVSFEQAEAYTAWLSEKTGYTYRLPTEEEWEHAALAGKSSRYFWGDLLVENRAICRNCGHATDAPLPADDARRNDFGLADMHGNMWEWVSTCAKRSSPNCTQRYLKGGSFQEDSLSMRAGNRNWGEVGVASEDIGFRVVREP